MVKFSIIKSLSNLNLSQSSFKTESDTEVLIKGLNSVWVGFFEQAQWDVCLCLL